MTGRARRVRALTLAGLTDSFGLACGWTVFNIVAEFRHGLAATGEINAAMLCGVALSSPATAWLTKRLDGRRTLQATAAGECLLRAVALAALFWNAPLLLIMALVLATNVVAWTGYAAMRAEIVAADPSGRSVTQYVAGIVAIEAIGATVAALLPVTSHGDISAHWVGAVLVIYSASLLPTAVVAKRSLVGRRSPAARAPITAESRRLLVVGTALMVLTSGPTLLYVALATRLHGHAAVAGAAIAFAAGSLLAPAANRWLRGTGMSASVLWPLWGAGMVIGWAAAPWSVEGLWLAQFLSGVCLTAFEGAMDAFLATAAPEGGATAALAHGSAARALGGAAAVRLLPLLAASAALSEFSAVSAAICLCAGAVSLHGLRPGRRAAAPPAADRRPGPGVELTSDWC